MRGVQVGNEKKSCLIILIWCKLIERDDQIIQIILIHNFIFYTNLLNHILKSVMSIYTQNLLK